MDHSMANPDISRIISYGYDKDHSIRTAQGDTYPVLPINQVRGKDFAILPAGVSASTIFNYVGVSVSGQAGPGYLQYDGHPGYDYAYGLGTDVYAAASGTVMTDDDLTGSNLAGSGMASYYMAHYHALIINHGQGYCSIYMHLSLLDPAYVDTSNPDVWKPIKASVSSGAHIGKTGSFDTQDLTLPAHFHFEVWRLDGGNTWNYADPYGYSGPAVPSGTQSITPNLWLGN
jgi:murein DD-endopeptidase MepM/ murein hydrolase activator NlpD